MKLQTGPGFGNRLLCPGLPDHLIASGEQLLWSTGGAVFRRIGEEIRVRAADGLIGFAYSSQAWVFLLSTPDGFRIVREPSDDAVEEQDFGFVQRCPCIGADWAVLNSGTERTVLDLNTGHAVSIPVGARDAHPQPWLSGHGVTWIDGLQVYRFRSGHKPRLAGTLPSKPTSWLSGPEGSAIFSFEDMSLGLGPGGSFQDLPQIDVASIRFSEDGKQFMAASPNGVERYSLDLAASIGQIHGRLIPVGYQETPLILDEDSGVLKTWNGTLVEVGFSPSAACHQDTRLYGPGGTAWNMETGERCWESSPLAATHIVANQGGVIQIGDRIEGFDVKGNRAFNIPLPIDSELDGEILDVQWADGFLFFEVEDGWVQVDFDGRRIGQDPPPYISETCTDLPKGWAFDEENGVLSKEGVVLPLPIDGAAPTDDARLLAWSEDGALYCLSAR